MLFRNNFKRPVLLCLIMLYGQTYCLQTDLRNQRNPYSENQIQKAERLVDEGLHQDAIPLYELITRSHPLNENSSINSLAACYLEILSPLSALNLLSFSRPFPFPDSRHYLLKSISFRLLNRNREALDILKRLQKMRSNAGYSFEIALNHYDLNRLHEAQLSFERVNWDFSNPSLYFRAQIYRAHIHIYENNRKAARDLLNSITLPRRHPLNLEKMYLLGVCEYLLKDYPAATDHLDQLLNLSRSKNSPWSIPALRLSIACCLCMTNPSNYRSKDTCVLLDKIRSDLDELMKISQDEIDYFLQGEFFLNRAYLLGDEHDFQAARELFTNAEVFRSSNGTSLAALKFAESFSSYSERCKQFQSLTALHASDLKFRLHRALNAFKEGVSLPDQKSMEDRADCFNAAFKSFVKAYQLYSRLQTQTEVASGPQILKYLMLSCILNPSENDLKQNVHLIQNLIDGHASNETVYYIGVLWKKIALKDPSYLPIAEKSLKKAFDCSNDKNFSLAALQELGSLYFFSGNTDQAESIFSKMARIDHDCPKALFWLALCAEKKSLPERKREILNELYSNDPHGPLAPLAYFYAYTYKEYLQGDRKATKHLKSMPKLFFDHPLTMNAFYLIGLDNAKDRLSDEGKISRSADPIAAIDAFRKAETHFEHLLNLNALNTQIYPYYLCLRYKCMAERGLANFALGKQSRQAKQQIYFEYATGVYKNLIRELADCSLENAPIRQIHKEALYRLARTLIKQEREEEAEKILDRLIELSEEQEQSRCYLSSKAWSRKGEIALSRQDFLLALDYFNNAEMTAEGQSFLSPDQLINLWIKQSNCCKEMKQFDRAMLLLSKAINHDAISGLRIKAMYLRADLYELQNRPELALKQLKAAAKKGGIWGNQAKEKLRDEYGY